MSVLCKRREAMVVWQHYESMTSALAQELCEQLRMVLAPTLAAKFKYVHRYYCQMCCWCMIWSWCSDSETDLLLGCYVIGYIVVVFAINTVVACKLILLTWQLMQNTLVCKFLIIKNSMTWNCQVEVIIYLLTDVGFRSHSFPVVSSWCYIRRLTLTHTYCIFQ